MELINNTTKTLRDDLAIEIHFYITDFYNGEGKKREERILYSKTKPRTQFVWNRI